MCKICTTPLEQLKLETQLFSNGCRRLSVIPKEMVNLTVLYCYGSPVRAIPKELTKLKLLIVDNCPIDEIPSELSALEEISACDCPNLRRLPMHLPRLSRLLCVNSRLLLEIPSARLQCTFNGCPWLPESVACYPLHRPSLMRIQRWYRRRRCKRLLLRYLGSCEFNEWFWQPDVVGGIRHIRQMLLRAARSYKAAP